jgi:ankyrin repeat protein
VNASSGTYRLTPLIYAAASDQAGIETLKLLLEKGADPKAADTDGETALDWAMHRFDRAKVELLKQHGATEGSTARDKTYPKPEGVTDARISVERSVALMLPAGPAVFQKRACISCHQQTMPAFAAAIARERGVPVDEAVARKNLTQILGFYKPTGDEAMQNSNPGGGEVGIGYAVMALAAEKQPLTRMTAGGRM